MKISLMNQEFKRLFKIEQQNQEEKISQTLQVEKESNCINQIEKSKSIKQKIEIQLQEKDSKIKQKKIGQESQLKQNQRQYLPFQKIEQDCQIKQENQDLVEQCLIEPRLEEFQYGNKQNQTEGCAELEDIQNKKISLIEASQIKNADGTSKFFKLSKVAQDIEKQDSLDEYLTIQTSIIPFQNQTHNMIITKNITTMINYENIKVENYFYEMLTATVSHDMRTPLNAIQGLLNNLDLFISDQRGKKFLKIIQNSSSFLTFLVNDLLDFFQIKNGKFRINNSVVDLMKTFQDLVDMFSVGATEKGIKVHFIPSKSIPKNLIIDEQRTKQVLLNLLQNALKFTFQGEIKVFLNYDAKDKQIKVSVQDTGVGVKLEDQDKLFKLFGKLDNTNQINTSGIGLGLGICKRMVEMLGGKIYIDSEYIDGARFTFTIACQISKKSSRNNINSYQSEDVCFESLDLESPRESQLVAKSNFEERKSSGVNSRSQINFQNKDYIIQSDEIFLSFHQDFNEGNCLIEVKDFENHQSAQNSVQNVQDTPDLMYTGHRLMQSTFAPTLTQNNHNIENSQINNSENNILDDSNQSFYAQQQQYCCECDKHADILVVDDNIFNIVTIQAILELNFGLKSDKASNGVEAFNMVTKRFMNPNCCNNDSCINKDTKSYKIILMDCNMPIMDGFTATEEIRKYEREKMPDQFEDTQILIVALTAYTGDQFKQKCFDAGMDDFLTKPISSDQLAGVLQLREIATINIKS
eukprot:403367855